MEWEFTPEDVVQGKAVYGLPEFRRDLAQGARLNMSPAADPYLIAFVWMVHRYSEPKVAMQGAIPQRTIMDGVEAGMPLEVALEAAVARHAQVAAVLP